MSDKLRIAWFSPLNIGQAPSSSVSAYCSDLLLPIFCERADIELFHDGFAQYRDYPTYHFLHAKRRHRELPFDIAFYQVEENRATDFARLHLGVLPGVVWFHDFIFTHFGAEPNLKSPWERVARKFNNSTLFWPARKREHNLCGPLGFREATMAVIPIFSCDHFFVEYKRNIELKLVSLDAEQTMPAFVLPAPVDVDQFEQRSRKKLKTIAYCGTPRIEHRAHKLFQALTELNEDYELQWMVEDNERTQAEVLLREFAIEGAALVSPRSPAEWAAVVNESDIAIHTLFSVYGQPGPYLSMSLAAGLPSLVTKFGSTEFLPDDVVFKVQAGEMETFEIREVLSELLGGKEFKVSNLVKEFSREFYDIISVSEDLWDIFVHSAPILSKVLNEWEDFQADARTALIEEAFSYLTSCVCKTKEQSSLCSNKFLQEQLYLPVFRELGWSAKRPVI